MKNIENNKLIAEFMGLTPMEMETFCGNCEEKLTVGDDIRYDKNYNAFCDNNDCCDGNRIINSTTLEPCWFGDGNGTDINDLNYNTSWGWLMPVVEKIRSLLFSFDIGSRITPSENVRYFVEVKNGKGNKEQVFHKASNEQGSIELTYEAVVEFIKWYNKEIS